MGIGCLFFSCCCRGFGLYHYEEKLGFVDGLDLCICIYVLYHIVLRYVGLSFRIRAISHWMAWG